MPSLIIMNLTFCGQAMLIFLAGLKQVPLTYYEAAEIDGASEWDKFIKITVPMISPVVLLNTVMGLISAFQIFNQPFIMTEGGPMKATYTYGMLIFVLQVRRSRSTILDSLPIISGTHGDSHETDEPESCL